MKVALAALAWLGYTLFCKGAPHGVTRMGTPGGQADSSGGETTPQRPRQPAPTQEGVHDPGLPDTRTEEDGAPAAPDENALPPTRLFGGSSAAEDRPGK